MPTQQGVPSGLGQLLAACNSGGRAARDAFARAALPYLRTLARVRAPYLPEDLQREIVGQACLNLVLQQRGFNTSRGSVAAFLNLVVRNAARQVRAAYARPGHATRARKIPGTKELASPCGPALVSLDALEEDDQPAYTGHIAATEARMDAVVILQTASESVGSCIVRVHMLGETLNEVADDVGVSRFTLSRQVAEFEEALRRSA